MLHTKGGTQVTTCLLIGSILQLPARAPLMLIPDSLSMRAAGGASLGLYGHARELRGELEEVVGVVPMGSE